MASTQVDIFVPATPLPPSREDKLQEEQLPLLVLASPQEVSSHVPVTASAINATTATSTTSATAYTVPAPRPTTTIAPPTSYTIPAPAPTTTIAFPTSRNNAELAAMKRRRKQRTVLFGVVGGVAGLFVLGPVGLVVGGLAGAIGTKSNSKRRERRRQSQIWTDLQQQQQQQQNS